VPTLSALATQGLTFFVSNAPAVLRGAKAMIATADTAANNVFANLFVCMELSPKVAVSVDNFRVSH
jgi:hypothetical protein